MMTESTRRTMARDIPAGKAHGSKERTPFKAFAAKKVNIKIKIKMKKRFFCSFFVLHLHVMRIKIHDIKNAQCVKLGKNSVLGIKLQKSLWESIARNRFRQPMLPDGPVRRSYSFSFPNPHRLF
jgi:hypothetical protein